MRRPRITRLPLWVWAAWLVATFGSFGILEGIGLFTDADGDTLSEGLRFWLGIDPVAPWRPLGVAVFSLALLGFTGWFLPHIVLKWGWWQPFERSKDDEAGLLRWSYASDGRTLLHADCGGEIATQTMTCEKCGAKNREKEVR